MLAISTTRLSKTFTPQIPRNRPWNLRKPGRGAEREADPTVALDQLSIRVESGECYGLLGPTAPARPRPQDARDAIGTHVRHGIRCRIRHYSGSA